jgi:hypothetical protein
MRRAALAPIMRALWTSADVRSAGTDEVRVAAVLAAYTVEASLEATRALTDLLPVGAPVVVVANSDEAHAALRPTEKIELVRGSNSAHEFSAYDEGLQLLRQLDEELDVVIFANDRLGAYRDGFLGLLTPSVLCFARDHGLALGNLDDPGRTFATPYGPLERYLRGNLFVVPLGVLPADFRMTSTGAEQFDALVPIRFPGDTATSTCLSRLVTDSEYASFLWDWLTTGWYRGGPVSPTSWSVLRSKVRDILNEHWLSVRLNASGVVPAYAEHAALLARMPDGRQRQKHLARLRREIHSVGIVRHGDASVRRTARGLRIALGALWLRRVRGQ